MYHSRGEWGKWAQFWPSTFTWFFPSCMISEEWKCINDFICMSARSAWDFSLHRVLLLLKANRFKWSSTQFFNLIDWTLCAAAYATCGKILLQYIVKSSIHSVRDQKYSHSLVWSFDRSGFWRNFQEPLTLLFPSKFELLPTKLKYNFSNHENWLFVSFLC